MVWALPSAEEERKRAVFWGMFRRGRVRLDRPVRWWSKMSGCRNGSPPVFVVALGKWRNSHANFNA